MKTDRHKKILEVIDRYEVGTQEELAKILNDEGYNVTQATVSRDIRELNLSKVSVDGKRTRYATLTKDKPVASDKFLTVLKEGFVSCIASWSSRIGKNHTFQHYSQRTGSRLQDYFRAGARQAG